MEGDFDLRVYIDCAIRYRWLIAGLTVAAALVALVVTVFLLPAYEATAVVVLTRPYLDTGNAPALLNGKAAIDLCNSDAVIQQLLDRVSADLQPEGRTLSKLKSMLTASTGRDPAIIKLTAKNSKPQLVAKIANTWADLYVHQVNNLYGQSEEMAGFFDQQVTLANGDLNKANQALVDFQSHNDVIILQAQLTAKQEALVNHLKMYESLKLLLQNVYGLRDQLGRQPAEAAPTLGDDVAALFLQISALNTQPDIPIQLQLPSTGTLSSKTVGQQVAFLSNLAKTIEAKQTEIQTQTNQLPGEIMILQGKIQEARAEESQVTRQRDLAQSVYTSLAEKATVTRIAVRNSSGLVRLASNAAVPDQPNAGRIRNTALGALAGLLVGVAIAFAIDYVRPLLSGNTARPVPVSGK